MLPLRWTHVVRLTAVLLAGVPFAFPAHAADDLEKQLLRQAPAILAQLKTRGVKNVGVLKFRVKKGTGPATDRAGTLNLRLAEKLELALILANKPRDPVGIVRDANRVAATIPAANHLLVEGRQALFSKPYPLAWGNESVIPDAFLTGVATIGANLRTMVVGVVIFDRSGKELEKLVQFEVRPDLEDLLESGESFTVRGLFDNASVEAASDDQRKDAATEEAVKTSLKVKQETEKSSQPTNAKEHPLAPANASAPVSLEIRYDNRPVTIEFREGAAFVPEPKEKQTVTLIVRRKTGKSRLGIVLKVNGENTVARQKLADAQCRPWVFEPKLESFAVDGFYLDDHTAQAFKVLSRSESQAKAIDYGEDVGTISLTVFPEQTAPSKPSAELLTDEGEDFVALTRGIFPAKPAANLSALKVQLNQSATRGLIVEGAKFAAKLETVTFKMDSVPIMSGVVRYYHPQDLPPP